MSQNIVPGCGHYDSAYGVCKLMYPAQPVVLPTLAKESQVNPPGALEGLQVTIPGLICTAAHAPAIQATCSTFVPRDSNQDENDWNL